MLKVKQSVYLLVTSVITSLALAILAYNRAPVYLVIRVDNDSHHEWLIRAKPTRLLPTNHRSTS